VASPGPSIRQRRSGRLLYLPVFNSQTVCGYGATLMRADRSFPVRGSWPCVGSRRSDFRRCFWRCLRDVQSRSVVDSAMLMLHSGRPYGTDSSRQRQDHARRPSCYTAIRPCIECSSATRSAGFLRSKARRGARRRSSGTRSATSTSISLKCALKKANFPCLSRLTAVICQRTVQARL